MRTEKQEVKRIEYITRYIANDGTAFLTEEECKKYEQTSERVINSLFDSLKHQDTDYASDMFYTFGNKETVRAVCIRNENELLAVNLWIAAKNKYNRLNPYEAKDIGTIQLIGWYDDVVWQYGSLEDYKTHLCNKVDLLADKLIKEEK